MTSSKAWFPMQCLVAAVAAGLLGPTASAFPVSAHFSETSRSFGLQFSSTVNGGGCLSSDETRHSNYGTTWWNVTLAVTEDDCGDDEVKVTGTAQHRSTRPGDPQGPIFRFSFDLMSSHDASHYSQGNHALDPINETLVHLFPSNFTFEYDIFKASFNFHVDEGFFNNDIDSYSFALTGTAVDEPTSLALGVTALLAALWQGRRRQRPN